MKVGLIAAVIVGAFALASYAVLGVVDSRNKSAEQRLEFCHEIERLKSAQREKAKESYANLDQTLRLLKVKKTPEVVRIARKNRDTELRRFKARSCE